MLISWVQRVPLNTIESLRNHDDDGNKNPTNLHIWQWKTVFLHALHVHFSIFWHFVDVLVLSTTWDDQFCRCVDDVSIWWQMFKFVFLCPKRWFQFNSRIVGTHFSSITSLNNWKMIAETRSYIFFWRSRFRRPRVCLSSEITVRFYFSSHYLKKYCDRLIMTSTKILGETWLGKYNPSPRWDSNPQPPRS